MIPYDKRSGKIWYNGELVDWSDVKVHVLSHGLHYASCVFEGERVYDGSIFKLEEHTSRLFHSARRMGFDIPYTEDEINSASKKIIATQKVENGYVRPVAWRGSEMMAISAQQTKIHVAIATWEWGSYFDPKLKVEGIKLNKKNPPFIANNKKEIIETLTKVLNNFDKFKKKSKQDKIFYKNSYSMKRLTLCFIKSNLSKYFNGSQN